MAVRPFRVRDIALQAGLSEATVDRVLHRRGGVRASTAAEVEQAVAELERQRTQLRLGGRTFMVDVVLDAPPRFSAEVRAALEAELPTLRPAVVRARFHCLDAPPARALAAVLDDVAGRRTHGVIVKAPDVAPVNDAVRRLAAARIPVVTLVTDLPLSPRVTYLGLDNRAAGATAAYLVGQWLGPSAGEVLVVRGNAAFRGEEEREMGFRATLRAGPRPRGQVDVVDDGSDDRLRSAVIAALHAHPAMTAAYAMYSTGASHAAVLDGFRHVGRPCAAFVVHDLNAESVTLLRDRQVSAVLHHDLPADLRRACYAIMQHHGALPGPVALSPSAVQVITPHNIPHG